MGRVFIGSALIRHIINNTEHDIINVDKLTYAGNLDTLTAISQNPRYNFKKLDICERNQIREVFEVYKPDIVMHLAAESHVDRSIDSPDQFIKTNIVGTYSMLAEARKLLY